MSLQIVYSPNAKITLTQTYNFILEKFGKRAGTKFLQKAEKTIALLAQQPFMFKASVIDANIRVGLITKQCSIFYRVTDTSIQLLYFWDNRQEPQF